jgi:uncharacterized membrane protein
MTKTLSFACVHFTVAFTLAWLITGSLTAGGLVALIEPCCNTVAFHLHERLWARRAAGRLTTPAATLAPA